MTVSTLTTEEIEAIRADLEHDGELHESLIWEARRLLATLDEANEELVKLRRQQAFDKGSFF